MAALHKECARRLHEAATRQCPIPQLTQDLPELTLDDAWEIQRRLAGHRLRERSALHVGYKMGLTSRAKMEQMGVFEAIAGHLTSDMAIEHGGSLQRAHYIHPRVEPEVAFVLAKDIDRPLSPAEALLAVEGVCLALDVLDSRYENFRFSLTDVIADNASSAGYVLGPMVRRPDELPLHALGLVLSVNGEVVQTGSSAAILEHPAVSLAALTRRCATAGWPLRQGMIVLAGAATAAVAVEPGSCVRLEGASLGDVHLRITP